MTNIWGFLMQTVAVSMIAGVLLILKKVFQDKLSARWQYGVWLILVLRIFWPVGMNETVFINMSFWTELIKAEAEQGLASAYTQVYQPVVLKHVFPIVAETPKSVTDWLFFIYTAGIVVCLLRYLISYWRIRMFLKKGNPVTMELHRQLEEVCEVYSLQPCKVVMVPGLASAFVCGVFSKVLVVPDDTFIDDKIILHELLHLKYKDSLQSVFWCVLRALHWCNPFLQMVFNRIGNDMETLCDQRVLEQLEGEERREYGMILLNMVNERYARVPGTTSVSNGGKNIRKRIEAIVRFKKYPQGMEVIAVCITVVLGVALFFQAETTYSAENFKPDTDMNLKQAVVMSRLNRCTTMEGALDTYAKGLFLENGIYILTASPLEKHDELVREMEKNNSNQEKFYHYDSGQELENCADGYYDLNGKQYNRDIKYYVCNLQKLKDGSYEAYLGFYISGVCIADNHLISDIYDSYEESIANTTGSERIIFVPVKIQYEDAWVVKENEDRVVWTSEDYCIKHLGINGGEVNRMVPDLPKIEKNVTCEVGTLKVSYVMLHTVQEKYYEDYDSGFCLEADLDAEMGSVDTYTFAEFSCAGHEREDEILSMAIDMKVIHEEMVDALGGAIGGSAIEGYDQKFITRDKDLDGVIDENNNWDGCVRASYTAGMASNYTPTTYPDVRIKLTWNSEVEEIMLEGDN